MSEIREFFDSHQMTRRDLLKLGTLSYADLLLSLQSPIIALPLFPDGSKTTAKETPLREIPGLTDKDELPPQLWERLREATVKAFASNLGADHGNMGSAVHIGNRVLLTNRHVVLDENNNNRQLPFILVGHNSYDWARVSRVWQHPSQDLAVLVHEPYSYIDADQPFGLTANPVAQKPLFRERLSLATIIKPILIPEKVRNQFTAPEKYIWVCTLKKFLGFREAQRIK